MARRTKHRLADSPATRRDIERLRREMADGFEQLAVNLAAALRLMQKEARRRRGGR